MKLIIVFFCLFSFFAFGDEKTPPLKITKLTENVYQHTSYKRVEPWGLVGASGLVLINGNNAHIIDTPWTNEQTNQLIEWIKSKELTLTSSIFTHFHEDSSGGISYLNSLKIDTYATTKTNELLSLSKRERANHSISSNTFELMSGVVEAFYPGAGHTEDNIVIWLAKEKILFGGCFVKSLASKNLGNTEDALIDDWPTSIQNVMNKYPEIKLVVPGHGTIGNRDLLEHTLQLTKAAKKSKVIKDT
jgi:glyoxylase-like metal-dependent hydrolase (beta-lactamase superfamily II)